MRTSAPGSRPDRRTAAAKPRGLTKRPARRAGFSLIELLIVLAIVAISVGVVSLSVRDRSATQLEEEGARLAALFEMARAEARASGAAVRWAPVPLAQGTDNDAQFRFIGLPGSTTLPQRWLDPSTRAEVVGTTAGVLGPEAILPAQRVSLRLGEQRLDVVTDGLSPFAAVGAGSQAPR